MTCGKAFTLIELLIVVAIIAILAAIAVPNFLEAQTRAKVSRAQSDLRSLTTAIEAYQVDWNSYPPPYYEQVLSTPVSYITNSYLEDPFGDEDNIQARNFHRYRYFVFDNRDREANAHYRNVMAPVFGYSESDWGQLVRHGYVIYSNGPDRIAEVFMFANPPGTRVSGNAFNVALGANMDALRTSTTSIYDPTNGTNSRGDVLRTTAGPVTGPLGSVSP